MNVRNKLFDLKHFLRLITLKFSTINILFKADNYSRSLNKKLSSFFQIKFQVKTYEAKYNKNFQKEKRRLYSDSTVDIFKQTKKSDAFS